MNCTLTSSKAPTSPYAGFAKTLTMSLALAPPVVVRQLRAERLTRTAAAAALGFLLPAISSSLRTPCNPVKIHHTSIIIIIIIKGNETGKIIKYKKLETLPFQHQQEMAKSSHSSTNKYAKP
jgi:hypothetical protein